MVLETTFTTGDRHGHPDLRAGPGRHRAGHDLGRGVLSLPIREASGIDRARRAGDRIRSADRVRSDLPAAEPGHADLRAGRGRPDPPSARLTCRSGAGVAFGRLTVSGGEQAPFGLDYGRFGQERPRVWSSAGLSGRLADTVDRLAFVVGPAPELHRALAELRPSQRPGTAGADLSTPPARSSPPRRPRSRRPSAETATGTTASPGSGTPR